MKEVTFNEVFEKFSEILVGEFGVAKEKITLESSLTDDLRVDSLDRFDLVMQFESTYSISIEDEEFDEIGPNYFTNDIINFVVKKANKN